MRYPACAADAQRVRTGNDPSIRMVYAGQRQVPYWEDQQHAAWAQGYYGRYGADPALRSITHGALMIGASLAADGPARRSTQTLSNIPVVTAPSAAGSRLSEPTSIDFDLPIDTETVSMLVTPQPARPTLRGPHLPLAEETAEVARHLR